MEELAHLPQGALNVVLGVEGGEGVLKDHLHAASQLLELGAVKTGQVHAVNRHRAAGGVHEAHDAAAQRGFSAARLPYDAENLAPVYVEAHVVQRLEHAVFSNRVVFFEAAHLDHDGIAFTHCGASFSRNSGSRKHW